MHMADALVSPPVAIAAGAVAATLIVIASRQVSRIRRDDIVPLMGVMGAFVFAAQMINFSIPGTGSSGHIIGGILLAALMGPWAAFLVLCSVLIIQCLVFADGGLMALGCNIVNMAAMSCLVAYPLVYRPLAGRRRKGWRLMAAAVAACVVGLELGALLVTAETELSGITALPTREFLLFMLPIHLAIGLCEGVATGLLLCFVGAYKPDMLYSTSMPDGTPEQKYRMSPKTKRVLWIFGIVAVVLAVSFTWLASSSPDGLEWSVAKVAGAAGLDGSYVPPTAVLPDYDSTLSGVIGGAIVVLLVWGLSTFIFRKRRVASSVTRKKL